MVEIAIWEPLFLDRICRLMPYPLPIPRNPSFAHVSKDTCTTLGRRRRQDAKTSENCPRKHEVHVVNGQCYTQGYSGPFNLQYDKNQIYGIVLVLYSI